ncbi:serine--tRNA ligase [Striga asiatica]|uniref:Serine--tRNA ligase n=1 Tax=Striga asiatica TaxID=4170 RepID=A0A5A7Q0Q1_STRAF|nr:serine--tRNA ligase [Striga asiatica]
MALQTSGGNDQRGSVKLDMESQLEQKTAYIHHYRHAWEENRSGEELLPHMLRKLDQSKQFFHQKDLDSNANTSFFSTTHTAQVPIPDDCVRTILKSHLDDCALDQCPFVCPWHSIRKPQPGRV